MKGEWADSSRSSRVSQGFIRLTYHDADADKSLMANATTETFEQEEIDITEEMIEAGAYVLLCELGDRDCLPGFLSEKDLAKQVYRAMRRMEI